VLIATADPAACFIPFAEPTARFLGIENNFLTLTQTNPDGVGGQAPDAGAGTGEIHPQHRGRGRRHARPRHLGLKRGAGPCLAIESNLAQDDGEQLSRRPVAD